MDAMELYSRLQDVMNEMDDYCTCIDPTQPNHCPWCLARAALEVDRVEFETVERKVETQRRA